MNKLFITLLVLAIITTPILAITNCETVSNSDSNKCTTCSSEYTLTLDNKQCGTSISNCTYLDNTTLTNCNTCASGYTLSTDSKTCSASSNSFILVSSLMGLCTLLF